MLAVTLRISIHALREEGDTRARGSTTTFINFYPRPPRGGRRKRLAAGHRSYTISIHALREEGDGRSLWYYWIAKNFYPRPPRGGRHVLSLRTSQLTKFLSTPSARRATCRFLVVAQSAENFYPRPPRGGRPESLIIINSKFEFLSTPSARRATKCCRCCCQYTSISIHALREEGDRWRWSAPPQRYNFYPRPPRGGRRVGHNRESVRRAFLSTPSARRATHDL